MAPGQSVSGDLTVRNLDLARPEGPGAENDLTAKASVDVTADDFAQVDTIKGSITVDAPRVIAAGYTAEHVIASADLNRGRAAITAKATAYGAVATARGNVTLPSERRPLAYDLRGDVRNVDLRRLPRSQTTARGYQRQRGVSRGRVGTRRRSVRL
jgi:hypothetical protein